MVSHNDIVPAIQGRRADCCSLSIFLKSRQQSRMHSPRGPPSDTTAGDQVIVWLVGSSSPCHVHPPPGDIIIIILSCHLVDGRIGNPLNLWGGGQGGGGGDVIFIAIFTNSNNSKIASAAAAAAAAAKISEVLRASLMTHPPHRAALDARIVTSVVAHLKLLRRQGRREGGTMRRRSQISLGVLPRSLLPPLFKIDANEKTRGEGGVSLEARAATQTASHTADPNVTVGLGRAGGPKRGVRSYQQTRLTTSLPASRA
jgi:hypothetical protein